MGSHTTESRLPSGPTPSCPHLRAWYFCSWHTFRYYERGWCAPRNKLVPEKLSSLGEGHVGRNFHTVHKATWGLWGLGRGGVFWLHAGLGPHE